MSTVDRVCAISWPRLLLKWHECVNYGLLLFKLRYCVCWRWSRFVKPVTQSVTQSAVCLICFLLDNQRPDVVAVALVVFVVRAIAVGELQLANWINQSLTESSVNHLARPPAATEHGLVAQLLDFDRVHHLRLVFLDLLVHQRLPIITGWTGLSQPRVNHGHDRDQPRNQCTQAAFYKLLVSCDLLQS